MATLASQLSVQLSAQLFCQLVIEAAATYTAATGWFPFLSWASAGSEFFRRTAVDAESQLLLACSEATSYGAPLMPGDTSFLVPFNSG